MYGPPMVHLLVLNQHPAQLLPLLQVFEINPWKAWSAVGIAVISLYMSELLISGEGLGRSAKAQGGRRAACALHVGIGSECCSC